MEAGGHTLHSVRHDAFNYVWDNSIEPALEVESGETIESHVRDASDEQIHEGSTANDVGALDFDHVNPASGPVFVRGARPGEVVAVEILAFRPRGWGCDGDHPRLRRLGGRVRGALVSHL